MRMSGENLSCNQPYKQIRFMEHDQIGEATAVYVDDSLRFVTTEGDHLRTYLESIKAPYVNAMDQNKRVSFVHDLSLIHIW